MTREELIRHIHVLIAYCHLELAYARQMTLEEWELVNMLAEFQRNRENS